MAFGKGVPVGSSDECFCDQSCLGDLPENGYESEVPVQLSRHTGLGTVVCMSHGMVTAESQELTELFMKQQNDVYVCTPFRSIGCYNIYSSTYICTNKHRFSDAFPLPAVVFHFLPVVVFNHYFLHHPQDSVSTVVASCSTALCRTN